MKFEKADHMLADAIRLGNTKCDKMTKYDVLATFAQTNALLSPDARR